MKQAKLGVVGCKRVGIGQPCAIVLRGETRNLPGSVNRFLKRAGAEIRRARMAPAFSDKHRDADALVAMLLNRFNPPAPNVDREAAVFGNIHRGVGCA